MTSGSHSQPFNHEIRFILNCEFSEQNQLEMLKPTNLLAEFRFFVLVFAIFGLWPYGKNVKTNLVLVIYSIVTFCFTFSFLLLEMYKMHIQLDYSIPTIVKCIILSSFVFTYLVIIVETLVHRKLLTRIMQKFSYIDWLFRTKFQQDISYRPEKRAMFIRFSSFSFIALFFRVVFFIGGRSIYSNPWPWYVIFSLWILRLRCFQVIFFVNLLRTRRNWLRDKLEEMICHREIQANNRQSMALDSTFAQRSVYDRLLYLKHIYGELHEIVQLINITFAWSLPLIIAQNFFELTGIAFWLYIRICKNNIDMIGAIHLSGLIISIVIVMGYLIVSCCLIVSCIGN